MKIKRRGFLGSLLAFVTVPKVMKGKVALWNPHPRQLEYLTSRDMRVPFTGGYGCGSTDVVAMELERVREHLPKLFERDDHFFASIENIGGDRQKGGTRRRKGRGRSQRGRRG